MSFKSSILADKVRQSGIDRDELKNLKFLVTSTKIVKKREGSYVTSHVVWSGRCVRCVAAVHANLVRSGVPGLLSATQFKSG